MTSFLEKGNLVLSVPPPWTHFDRVSILKSDLTIPQSHGNNTSPRSLSQNTCLKRYVFQVRGKVDWWVVSWVSTVSSFESCCCAWGIEGRCVQGNVRQKSGVFSCKSDWFFYELSWLCRRSLGSFPEHGIRQSIWQSFTTMSCRSSGNSPVLGNKPTLAPIFKEKYVSLRMFQDNSRWPTLCYFTLHPNSLFPSFKSPGHSTKLS